MKSWLSQMSSKSTFNIIFSMLDARCFALTHLFIITNLKWIWSVFIGYESKDRSVWFFLTSVQSLYLTCLLDSEVQKSRGITDYSYGLKALIWFELSIKSHRGIPGKHTTRNVILIFSLLMTSLIFIYSLYIFHLSLRRVSVPIEWLRYLEIPTQIYILDLEKLEQWTN